MSYSRRQLYAMGEPIGDSATYRKVGGGLVLGGGGGGGGSSTGTQTQISELPEWARGYAKSALEKGAALSEKPYQAYDQNRIAGFSPLQLQSQQGAANMQTSGATGAGIGVAGQAAMDALNTRYQGGGYGNQFQAPEAYQAGQFSAIPVTASGLQQYQMGPAERVSTESFRQPGAAEAYMSPYMQNVVDIQQREAQRQADIAGTSRGAAAVKSGAFGGSRQAVMDAEAARNLAMQKGDIQATGQQAAFQNAQQQFNAEQNARLAAQQANQQAGLTGSIQNLNALLGVQQLGAGQNLQSQLANQQYGLQAQQLGEQSRQFGAGQGLQAASLGAQYGQAANQLNEQANQYGAGLGMQGLQTALTGANTLGALGGQQFQQGMDINKLQNAYGGQQQALRQQGLSQAYQDFQNEQNYPYKQLGFFSDLIRGLPLGQQTSKSIYEPEPGMAQQIGSLGMGAYGLSKFMADGGMAYADGGEVQGYAGDDGSVVGDIDSKDNVSKFVHRLKTDADLQRAGQAAQARGDIDQLEAVQAEMAMRASLRRGIAGGVTDEMADRMAGGGVVAFANGGGLSSYMKNIVDASTEDIAETPEQRLSGIKGALPGIQSLYGESAMKPFMEELKKDREGLSKQKEQGEGLAYLAGAEALLRPGSKSRAVTSSLAAIGGGLAKANKEHTEANAKLRQAEMTLAASEQARADGMVGKAESLYDKGRTEERQAIKDKVEANEKLATIQASVDNSIRSSNASMAAVNKPGERERMLAQLDAIQSGKQAFQGKTGKEGAEAFMRANAELGSAMYGVKYTGQDKTAERVTAALKDTNYKLLMTQRDMLAGKSDAKSKAEVARLDSRIKELEDSAYARVTGGEAGGGGGKLTPPPAAVEFLRSNPDARRDFDAMYGAGAADKYLGK